jgi:hypothetical protein
MDYQAVQNCLESGGSNMTIECREVYGLLKDCSSLESILENPILTTSMLGGSPCHHGMARPRVAGGRDGLQLEVSCEYIE